MLIENLRHALEWALGRKLCEASLNLCKLWGLVLEYRCYWLDGLSWLTKALEAPVQDLNHSEKTAYARALTRALLAWHWRYRTDASFSDSSLALAIETSNKKDIAIAKFVQTAA
jgi:hypothetical protein